MGSCFTPAAWITLSADVDSLAAKRTQPCCGALSPQVSPPLWFLHCDVLHGPSCTFWLATLEEDLLSDSLSHSSFWPSKMSVYVLLMVVQISTCLAVIGWLLYVRSGKGGPGLSGRGGPGLSGRGGPISLPTFSFSSKTASFTWLSLDGQRRVINFSFIPGCYV